MHGDTGAGGREYESRQIARGASSLMRYPDGFNDPAMATIRKKHNVNKMVEFSREALSKPTASARKR